MSDRPATLGSYTIERELGRGGMGIVYLARDPRLDRAVAIKVLPDAFTHDPERLARFEREAKILASLNHPNIGSIFGLEQDGDRRFLVLEYIPGDTLTQRTTRGALPLDEALDVCRQIAAAVEAAHESGVIHRDLKPGNVKITPDGGVKVLDFGLAKGAEGSPSSIDLSQSPTIAFSATGAGVILGTAAYMSPEQARGKPVDRRTDIWSFGCVLYECLTGRQIFAGETVSDTIAQILERSPDWSALPTQTPSKVRELLERCFEKDAKKRLRDIGDARIELEAAIAARSTATRMAAARAQETTRTVMSPRTLALAAGLLVLGAALGIGIWNAARPRAASSGGTIRLSVIPPAEIRVIGSDFTPDGGALVMSAVVRNPAPGELPLRRLYTRRLDSFEIRPIPGTEGVESYFFSPDGKWIVFRARVSQETSQRRLAKVALDGNSPVVTLADWDDAWGRAMTWMPNGDILMSKFSGNAIVRVPASGGATPTEIKLDMGGASGYLALGNALPDGSGLFAGLESWGPRGYQNDTWLVDPKTGKARELIKNSGSAVYVPTGHVVFSRRDALYAAPFDLGKRTITGEVVPLMSGLRAGGAWGDAYFVVGGGNLFFAPGGVVGARRTLMMIGAKNDTVPFSGERRAYENLLAVSRDGRKAAVVIGNARGTFEIWIAERDRPGLQLGVALSDADCDLPVWSPDGERLAFARNSRRAQDGIYVVRPGSGQPPTLIRASGSPDVFIAPTSWAPDGSGLLALRDEGGRGDILFIPLSSDTAHTPRPFRATPADERGAVYSPDGRMVAFASDESGKDQVYVARIAPDGSSGGTLQVSAGSGVVTGGPYWTGDGKRVLYCTDADRVMSVAISATGALSAAPPVELFNLVDLRVNRSEWAVLPDGRLFAIRKSEDEDEIRRFDVVVHWLDELRAAMAKAPGAAARR